MRGDRATIPAVEEQWVLRILCVWVFVALVFQRAKCMRRIILSSVTCPALPYFSAFLRKRHEFRRKKLLKHKMWDSNVSTNFIQNSSHSKNKWARYDQKCILVLTWNARYACQILIEIEFSRQIFEKYWSIKISWKSVHWPPSCHIRTDWTFAILQTHRKFNAK